MPDDAQGALFKVADLDVRTPRTVPIDGRAIRFPSHVKLAAIAGAQTTARTVIPRLEPGLNAHVVTNGAFGLLEIVEVILEQTGPADLTFAMWASSEDGCDLLAAMLHDGRLRSVRGLFDHRMKINKPKAAAVLKELTGASAIRFCPCHAKVAVIRNDSWAVTVLGSANYNTNPRIEVEAIVEARDVADFHAAWIDDAIKRLKAVTEREHEIVGFEHDDDLDD